ncbi:hypothetical protein ACSZN5_03960 [Aeromonas caviae]
MEPTQTTESHNNSEITLQQAIDQARPHGRPLMNGMKASASAC